VKYKVCGTTMVTVTVTVEAHSEDDACEQAYEVCSALTPFAGNCGTDKIVGVDEDCVSLDVDDEIEYTSAEAMEYDDSYEDDEIGCE
jgi:hypothetical protein